MTLEIDGVDIIALAEIAVFAASALLLLVAGIFFYLLVRPPRHVRDRKRHLPVQDESEAEAMLALIDRMETRLETLERLMADRGDRVEGSRNGPQASGKMKAADLEPAESRETGRL